MTAPTPSRPPRRSGGFFGWLLTLTLTVALAVAAGGAFSFYLFNYRPETPAELATARADLATLRSEQQIIQTQLTLAQQQAGNVDQRTNDNRERLDEVATNVANMQILAADLGTSISLGATVRADTVANNATARAFSSQQATTLARVSEIERQTRLLAAFVNDLASLADDISDAVEPDATPLPTTAAPTLTPTVVISTTVTP